MSSTKRLFYRGAGFIFTFLILLLPCFSMMPSIKAAPGDSKVVGFEDYGTNYYMNEI